MTRFRSSGLQQRTAIVLFGACSFAFVVIGLGFLLYQAGSLKMRVQQRLAPYADIISSTAETALNFEDADRAREILSPLKKDPQILQAQLVLANGSVLAAYPEGSPPLPLDWPAHRDGVYLEGQTALLVRSLPADVDRPPRLVIRMSLAPMRHEDWLTLVLGGLAALVMLLVISVTQLFLLQRAVLSPVAQLAATVEQARQKADYRQRVPAAGQDELATLGKSFNTLLATVEQREAALQQLSNSQRAILDNAAYAIVATDTTGLITRFNPAAERILGYSAAEIVGRHTPEMFHLPEEIAARAQWLTAKLGEPIPAGLETFVAEARRGLRSEAEWTYVRKDGRQVPTLLSITALRDEQGAIIGFMGLSSDITERKQAEAKLLERETKYRLLFENMVTGFALNEIICDEQGRPVDSRFLEVNPAFERLTGLAATNVLGRTLRETLPNTEKYWIDTFGRVAQTGEPMAYENYAVALGKYFDTWVFSPKSGQFAVVFSDITSRKKFEEELRQKNSLLEATLEATADGLMVVAANGQITGYNRQLAKLWRVPDELLQTPDSTGLFAYLQAQLSNPAAVAGQNQDFNNPSKSETFDVLHFADGRVFERYSRPQLVAGQVVGRVWSFRDVSVARQAEAALRDSEYKFKMLYETSNDAIFLMNQTVCVDCNQTAAEMFGCRREALIGADSAHFSPERQADGSRSQARAAEKIAVALAGQPQSFEWIHCRADGTPFNTEVSLNRFELHGEFLVQAVVRDITERKFAEAARYAAEELYRTLVHASPEGITVLDLQGRITYSSPRALALYRLPDEMAAHGLPAFQFVAPPDQPRAQKLFQNAVNGRFVASERFVLIRGDGTQFVAELSGALLHDRLGVPTGIMVITHDVTDRQRQEDELKNKNAELERFTYTVSHDLKSPLITIKGFAGALLVDLETGRTDRLADDLRRIILAADKMTALLNGLLELSRIGRIVNSPTQVSMNALVRTVLELLSGSIAQQQARITVQPDLPPVHGDPQRLQEVLQNLVENALKFPLDGVPPAIEIGSEKIGDEVAFFVRDQGRGIEPRYQDQVFGLFNKLDARAEGSGIGLALVHRIVKYHGGRVWVDSQGRGKGTTFYFTLPPGRAISPPIQPSPQTKT